MVFDIRNCKELADYLDQLQEKYHFDNYAGGGYILWGAEDDKSDISCEIRCKTCLDEGTGYLPGDTIGDDGDDAEDFYAFGDEDEYVVHFAIEAIAVVVDEQEYPYDFDSIRFTKEEVKKLEQMLEQLEKEGNVHREYVIGNAD